MRPYERYLHRLAERLLHGRGAVLPAALLYLALLSPYLVSRSAAHKRQWFIDLIVYRDAGRAVLNGGHELYRFASADGHLPFTYPPFAALLCPWLASLPPPAHVLILTAPEPVALVWVT